MIKAFGKTYNTVAEAEDYVATLEIENEFIGVSDDRIREIAAIKAALNMMRALAFLEEEN